MTKTELLAIAIQIIYRAHRNEIDRLDTHGPRGGRNARNIPGWQNVGNATITQAVKLTDLPTLRHWAGYNCRPTAAIPACVYDACWGAYIAIFKTGGEI